MGFFGGHKVYVSSVTYNMAGPIEDRPNFLKTMVVGNIISSNDFNLTDVMQTSYLHGPAIKLRRFFNWASNPDNYGTVGIPDSFLAGSVDLDPVIIAEEVPHDPTKAVKLQKVEFGHGDYNFWAEKWIAENDPTIFEVAYTVDYAETETTGEIVITLPDLTTYSFVPADFSKDDLYIYVAYNEQTEDAEEGPIVTGDVITLTGGDPFPSETGWVVESNTSTPQVTTLYTTTTVDTYYTDGTPYTHTEETTDDDASWILVEKYLTQTEYNGQATGDDELTATWFHRYTNDGKQVEVITTHDTVVEDIGGGHTKTTITRVDADTLVDDRWYRTDTQEVILKAWGPIQYFIYKVGSGNTDLDAMLVVEAGTGQYFPHLPLRFWNKYVTEYDPIRAEQVNKAYKRLTGKHVNTLLEMIDDNPSVGDIDFAYLIFGVSLNTKENACRKYLYNYFHKLMESQYIDETNHDDWVAEQEAYQLLLDNWAAWKEAQSDDTDPLYATPEPVRPAAPPQPRNSVRIYRGSDTNFDMTMAWSSIAETTGTGLAKVDAKVGEVWWANEGEDNYNNLFQLVGSIFNELFQVGSQTLFWQITEDSWKALTIKGLIHYNLCSYDGKSVNTTGLQALGDSEESGFLVPLHYPTFKEMSLVDSTQMSTACMYLVFNCYQVVSTPWYATGFFKIIIVIAIVVIAVLTGGIGAGTAGLLGTAGAVGTAVGLTGLAAVIAGALINAIAAMILTQIIMAGATALFGEKLGAIIGAIASFVALQVGTAFSNGASLADSFSGLMSAQNILAMTSAVGSGISGYMAASAQEIVNDTTKLLEDYEKQSKEISDLYAQNIGYGNGIIDPMSLTDASKDFLMEPRSSFLSRTLMTGTDVAQMSMDLLTNFSKATLSTALPT